jgi:hypothetical protein
VAWKVSNKAAGEAGEQKKNASSGSHRDAPKTRSNVDGVFSQTKAIDEDHGRSSSRVRYPAKTTKVQA